MNPDLPSYKWEIDLENNIVDCKDLPYHFEFHVTEYKETGEAYRIDGTRHMDFNNIHLHLNNDEIYLNMRLASRAYLDEFNKKIAC